MYVVNGLWSFSSGFNKYFFRTSGTFSASFIVPAVGNGVYNVTSIDTQGNIGVAPITVDVSIPEGFSVGVAVLLSSLAVIASSRYFRKRPRIVN